jgi:hypothetical protein
MCVSDVVQLPLFSLDGELEVPVAMDIVARAGTGFVDLAGNESDSEVDSTPPCPRRVSGGKIMGLEDTREEESLLFSPNTSALPTNYKVSKYLFFSCLAHYLEGIRISEANPAAVELCIFVEPGAAICRMDTMEKEKKKQAYFNKYMGICDKN